MKEKIDFVITWVDSNDLKWREERNHYAALEHKEVDNSNARYRTWDNLKYWFRGVEKFAPWVNKIYFVTYGHLPEWLNTNHPKLQIVKHVDFIPTQYLPTYHSKTIENHFYKIEGLSEQFVYFNDDMFLIDHVSPTRFFRNGLPCDIGGMTVNFHSGMFGASVLLAKTLINEHFNKKEVVMAQPTKWFNWRYVRQSLLNLACCMVRKNEFIGFVNPHLPQSLLKKTYLDLWANCEKDLTRTCKSRFRQHGDVAFWLIRYWQLASNQFAPVNTYKDGVYYLIDNHNAAEIADCINRQKKKIICLNDNDEIANFGAVKEQINGAFSKILPEKSKFEK